ncbi:hypothetical protein FRC07_008951, partial [Ceratobasidium sp. 392]
MTSSRLESLFDNHDRQSVPKAHALLKAIYDASQLPEIQLDTANRAFILLAEFVHSFYAPHTTPSLSLSQQVAGIAKCAFLLFTIFRADKTGFISSQLYYDIQASIKNAIFCIAKTQLLDRSLPFYLIQLGDDRLEGLFGIYRTASSDSNPDILQMAERAGAVQPVNNILTENPTYDRKPYRLSLEGADGIDHLNPAGWLGDVCVNNVVLRSAWVEGRTRAEEALRRARMVPCFDRNSLRTSAGGLEVDLMRPFGKYVGVTALDIPEDGVGPSIFVQHDIIPAHPSAGPNPSPTNPNPEPPSSVAQSCPERLTDEELPLEYLLPPCMPAPQDDLVQITEDPLKRGWMPIDARWVHLESATRLFFGTDSREKSTDRLRRVCGFSRYPSLDSQSDSILGDLCLIGQLILALVRVGTEIALAVLRVSSIKVGSVRSQVESLSLDHLTRSDVVLAGQILALEYDNGIWYWKKSFVSSSGGTHNSIHSIKESKPMLMDFRACAIELVNPTLLERQGDLVWSLEHDALAAATDILWIKSSEAVDNIPIYLGSREHRLIHLDASQAVKGMPAHMKCISCKLCGRSVPIEHQMRTHVAKHLLAKQLGIEDPLLTVP